VFTLLPLTTDEGGCVNPVQGLDDLWQKELEQVDARMRESLRTKAQLSDRDIDDCYRSFTQDLLRRQSMCISHDDAFCCRLL